MPLGLDDRQAYRAGCCLREDVSPLGTDMSEASDPAPEALCGRPLDHFPPLFPGLTRKSIEAGHGRLIAGHVGVERDEHRVGYAVRVRGSGDELAQQIGHPFMQLDQLIRR